MTKKQFTRFAEGDLVYRYSSTKQKEGDAGIALRVILGQEGDEPHVVYQRRDGGNSVIVDCKDYGYGGPPKHFGKPLPSLNGFQMRGRRYRLKILTRNGQLNKRPTAGLLRVTLGMGGYIG